MEILEYIKELLLLNDCVIIPGFGGFVSNYKSATLEGAQFCPPGKSFSFNRKLNFNDGLLINHVASKEGINYIAARKRIDLFVQELNYRLTDGETITIKGLGILNYDEHENLQFTPGITDCVNPESYGLPDFSFETIYARTIVSQPPATTDEERDTVEVIFSKRKFKKVLLAIPLLIALAVIPLKNKNIKAGSWLHSDLNFIPAIISSPKNISTKTTDQATVIPSISEVTSSIQKTTNTEKLVNTKAQNSYFIIGGSFRDNNNANSFLEGMLKKGYPAQNLGIIKGLHYIALDSYDTLNKAKEAIANFKMNYPESGVWIYTRK